MKGLVGLVIVLAIVLSCRYRFAHYRRLPSEDRERLRRYLTREYETIEPYLSDETIDHYFICDSDVLVAYFQISPHSDGLYVDYLYTNPSYRKQGFAKKLIQYALPDVQDTLHAWTGVGNIGSQRTLTGCGFVETGRTDGRISYQKIKMIGRD